MDQKTINTLIKLNKLKLDELRRQVAQRQQLIGECQDKITQISQEMTEAYAMMGANSHFFVEPFIAKSRKDRQKLSLDLASHQEELATHLTALQNTIAEKKRYEIIVNKQNEMERLQQVKLEQKQVDELTNRQHNK